MKITKKLESGQLDLEENFAYRGINFTCKSYGKGGSPHSKHVAEGVINGETRIFSSYTRKQAKDMFKKAVRKHSKRMEILN